MKFTLSYFPDKYFQSLRDVTSIFHLREREPEATFKDSQQPPTKGDRKPEGSEVSESVQESGTKLEGKENRNNADTSSYILALFVVAGDEER